MTNLLLDLMLLNPLRHTDVDFKKKSERFEHLSFLPNKVQSLGLTLIQLQHFLTRFTIV